MNKSLRVDLLSVILSATGYHTSFPPTDISSAVSEKLTEAVVEVAVYKEIVKDKKKNSQYSDKRT